MTGLTPFRLVSGKEVVIPMKYISPSLRIAAFTNMANPDIMEERMSQLLALEGNNFLARSHQQVRKAREKAWHDNYIKKKKFHMGDLVLLYDNMFVKFLGKFKTHWLGPYVIKNTTDGGMV